MDVEIPLPPTIAELGNAPYGKPSIYNDPRKHCGFMRATPHAQHGPVSGNIVER
jgi:hypothetical protein